VGRELLARALEYAEGTRAGMIVASADPRALRLYAQAGFALRPSLEAHGTVAAGSVPRPAVTIREGTVADLVLVSAVSRAVRGASSAPDLPVMLAAGAQLHCVDGRGFAVSDAERLYVLAALDEPAAVGLLRAALASAPAGRPFVVKHLTGGQDWAVGPLLAAGLRLVPGGAVCVRGAVGPLRPYLPHGAFL
jgi:hypothetical protein